MVHSTQETVKATSTSIIDTIKENPIPAALAGIGLAWLFMNGRSSSRGSSSSGAMRQGPIDKALHQVGTTAGNVAHSISETAGNVAHQAGQLAHQAGASISSATHGAGDTMSQYAHGAQESAMQLAHEAKVQAYRLENRVEHTFQANPLAIGFGLLAVGTAVGLAIPSTRREDAWMGEVRDDMVGKARELAHGALDSVEDVAKHVAADAARALKDNAKTLGSTTQKITPSTF